MSFSSATFRRVTATPWTALLGIAIGLVLAPGGGVDWLYAIYDDVAPVARMEGKIISRDDSSVVLSIQGEKLRNCHYLALQAYAERDSILVEANSSRIDRMADGQTKPTGVFSIGKWRVWPVDGAQRIKVFVKYSCSGRLVLTKVADVSMVEGVK